MLSYDITLIPNYIWKWANYIRVYKRKYTFKSYSCRVSTVFYERESHIKF